MNLTQNSVNHRFTLPILTLLFMFSPELLLKFSTISIAFKISTNIFKKLSFTPPKLGVSTRVGPK